MRTRGLSVPALMLLSPCPRKLQPLKTANSLPLPHPTSTAHTGEALPTQAW